MTRETTVYQANPVLTRFKKIRAGWLGFLEEKPRRRRKKTSLGHRIERASAVLRRRVRLFFRKLTRLFLNTLIAVSIVAGLVWLGPKLFYFFFSPKTDQVQAEQLAGDFQLHVNEEELREKKKGTPLALSQPPYNENLPEGDWLIVPRIGVRSLLQPTEQYEEALATGLWLAPDFGTPGDKTMPMIVAGHRFGFKWWWQDDYWKYHSFYLLPDLEPGDTVEVISGRRKYQYEIYAGEEGTEITDYQADLILYTCKHLDSPVRIFRYAKLLPPEGETPLGEL